MDFKYILIILFGWGLLSLVACVRSDQPSNFPPALSLDSVTNVTRTSAVLVGNLHIPKGSHVDFCHFCYGDKPEQLKQIDCLVQEGIVRAELNGLKPGTSYFCYLEAGTTGNTVMSNSYSFQTYPNEVPSIAEVKVIGQGPCSVMLHSTITDDGGESVQNVGFVCECDGEIIKKESAELVGNTFDARFTGLETNKAYIIRAYAENSIGINYSDSLSLMTSDAFQIQTPGTLSLLVSNEEVYTTSKMVVTGPLNGSDIRLIREMAGASTTGEQTSGQLKLLDITDAFIVESDHPYDDSHYTENDAITSGMFKDCRSLADIRLPYSVKRVEVDAFTNCSSLKSILVNELVEEMKPSYGCVLLERIDVSAANPYLRSVDGLLYNKSSTSLLWYPLGKQGKLELSSSLIRLGDYALQGCLLSDVELPQSLQELGIGAFYNSVNLTHIIIPDLVKSVSTSAFQECYQLQTVTLGSQVERLNDYCFGQCSQLKDIYLKPTLPPLCSELAFFGIDQIFQRCIIHVPIGCMAIYRNHSFWGRFDRIYEY